MFIHPWDSPVDDEEWRTWLDGVEKFGTLAVNNRDPSGAPLLLPAHFTVLGEELLLHFARPNPVWTHLEVAERVRLGVTGDYAYIPSYWRASPEAYERSGAPTSYYTSVQFVCAPTIIDDPQGKVEVLTAQLADIQPEGRHGTVAVGSDPYGRLLAGIRALRLTVLGVDAKFKYDDQKPTEHRQRVASHLEVRGVGLDAQAAAQQRRRMETVGPEATDHDLYVGVAHSPQKGPERPTLRM